MTTTTCRRAAAVVLLALTTATACTDAEHGTVPPPSVAVPSPSSVSASSSAAPDPEGLQKTEVLQSYLAFWEASTDARTHPNRRHPRLARFATDKALAAEQATIVLYRQQGIVWRGSPKLTPTIVSVDLLASPQTAEIHDCVDISDVEPPEPFALHFVTTQAA